MLSAVAQDLAQQIMDEHRLCRQAYWNGLSHARNCGQLLVSAKQSLPYGEWADWLKIACPEISIRTASSYMRVAVEWHRLEPFINAANLSFRDALTLLSEADSDQAIATQEPTAITGSPVSTPEPSKPAKTDYNPGQRCQVSKRGNVYDGQEVEILERQSGFYVAKTPDGNEYPFLGKELEPVTGETAEPEVMIPRKLTKTQQLETLLERVFEAVGHYLPSDLYNEVAAAIGKPA